MTRTDRLAAVIKTELDVYRAQLDTDDCLQVVVITVKLSEGGWPKLIEVDRKCRREFAKVAQTT